ncbi:BbsI [Azoarcus sp. CIB]|uniref:YbhB/YbcL family Raf kinase inhibitor-like protein n=1 Tax=unclassified Azoarcus TaxID=2629479 RepID=UPI000274B866|nr:MULTISPECIES: YbhB/YbcL family Raf kinase inhibitor-like protein [unclassified Azoarcus]ABK15664.1 BbsI [Azoarcus sp. CIB]AKU14404.1 BbsI [Azoarcus sp. CIB]AYH46005.1 phospholipid-binding protein [Azoarcus sp. DN11]
MRLTSSFGDNRRLPDRNAFAVVDAERRFRFGANRSPAFTWNEPPAGTRSFVLLCHDPDVPSRFEQINRDDIVIPESMPRVDFFHWVLVDLPAAYRGVAEGKFSDGVMPRGKPGPAARHGARHGLNDFTRGFAGDEHMAGLYFGYDGPCPPWNDERVHRYVFTLYAVDFDRCPLEGRFTGPDVLRTIEGHVLGQASLTARYSLNPRRSAG